MTWRSYAAMLALVSSVTACATASGGRSAEEADVQTTAGEVSAVLEALDHYPDARVEITVGVEHWQTGRITLVVTGGHDCEVVQLSAGTERRYPAAWDAERRGELGRGLLADGVLGVKPHPGEREPDDVPVIITISRGDRQLFAADVWYGDRYADAALDRVLRRWEAAVEDITKGVLPYGG